MDNITNQQRNAFQFYVFDDAIMMLVIGMSVGLFGLITFAS